MTTVDNASSKPTLSPRLQTAVTLLTLAANAYVAADKCRQERLAGETLRPTTLEDVMAKAGLKIPGLQDALVQLMGGSEEAKKAASLLLNTPELAELVRQLMGQPGRDSSSAIVTPPPAPKPTLASAPGLAKFRPEFTSGAREAARGPSQTPPLAKFRPEFMRGAGEAARSSSPVSSSQSFPRAPVAATQQAQPSLVARVEEQLDALRRRMKAHEAELEIRLNRAEAELAVLQRQIQELRAAYDSAPGDVAPTQAVQEGDPPHADERRDFDSEKQSINSPPAQGNANIDEAPPLSAGVSEQEIAKAIALVAKFADEADLHHQEQLRRVVSVEHAVSTMRTVHGRNATGSSAYG
ncbi:hypothetical protein OV203_22645 [Nannocystis sp. ILAH1]|uniref:hypothetical protein n=1 Tax=Nannocystis sp. ILAH1 TaxID=2996789 RepID=UPI002271FE6B|nr:hypothetical protein [Nannocystis sp. ILAH1]MCY0989956.1 hypothetical protein [Nannocystis sp. ILAH1]